MRDWIKIVQAGVIQDAFLSRRETKAFLKGPGNVSYSEELITALTILAVTILEAFTNQNGQESSSCTDSIEDLIHFMRSNWIDPR